MDCGKPVISIIVPVYKAESYIDNCLNSIIKQIWNNLEIIVVNDGSPDRSGEICNKYAEIDHRIKVIHKENGGAASARNVGLDMISGEYVGFVDADDNIEPYMYQRLYELIVRYNGQIACCGISYTSLSNKKNYYFNRNLNELLVLNSEEALEQYLTYKTISSGVVDKLFHKSIFKNLRFHEGITHEDAMIIPRCFYNAQRIIYTSEPMYHCILSLESVSRRPFSISRFDRIFVWKSNIDFIEKNYPKLMKKAKVLLVCAYLDVIYEAKRNRKCEKERIVAQLELNKFLKINTKLPYKSRTKIRVMFYKVNPRLYDLIYSIIYKLNIKR